MAQYFLQVIGAGDRFNLHSGINSVGRNATNDVRLHEASVSSFHCELEVTADRLWLRDLQSTNGTRLNDRPIEAAEVRAGDVLTVGHLRLQLDCETPPVRIPPIRADVAPLTPKGTAAYYQCSRCQKVWADAQVQRLVLGTDRTELRFCPECSGRCTRLEPSGSEAVQAAEPSLLKRLSRTIKIGRKTGH